MATLSTAKSTSGFAYLHPETSRYMHRFKQPKGHTQTTIGITSPLDAAGLGLDRDETVRAVCEPPARYRV